MMAEQRCDTQDSVDSGYRWGTKSAAINSTVSMICCGKSMTMGETLNSSHITLQVLNGAIAAALFNLLYDLVLSQKVKWYAMCPVVDFLNHKSTVQV